MKISSYYLLPPIFFCLLILPLVAEAYRNNEQDSGKLVDFGVIGFPKCATSFLRWNVFGDSNPQSFFGNEKKAEVHPYQADFSKMYRKHVGLSTQDGKPIRNGFKSPLVLMTRRTLRIMSEKFPSTNFIVSTRHPVLWYQSWYNYRLRKGTKMSPPEQTIGSCYDQCERGKRCVKKNNHGCTGIAKFHQFLSRLGWTDLNTADERSLLEHHKMSIHKFPRAKLFLMESSQLSAENRTRADIFIQDLERFVGMENSIPKLEILPKKKHSYRKGVNPEEVEKKTITICDDKHKILREHLVSIGKNASEWIEKYFLKSSHVFVSDEEYFIELIRRWKYDPCEQAETDE